MPDHDRHFFPTTRWSLVELAGGPLNEQQREALNVILTEYWTPLKAHLLTKRKLRDEDADDVLQGFIKTKILEKNLIDVANADRGKFRSLLLKSLDNHLRNEKRTQKAAKRGHDLVKSLDDENTGSQAVEKTTPDAVYDYEWASSMIQQALSEMEQHCMEAGREPMWRVFDSRVLGPVLRGEDALPYDDLVREFRLTSNDQASNLLVSAKRMFERFLRASLAKQGLSNEQIDQEIDDLVKSIADY